MSGKIYNFMETYIEMMANHSDPRTQDWPMMFSPLPTMYLVAGYVLLIKLLSSQIMKNKKPFEMQSATLVYNAIQCAICVWLFYTASELVTKFSIVSKPTILETDPNTLMILNISWYFYIFRFLDFANTIILILRKQNDQVTLLHLFYNSMVPIILWSGLKFVSYSHFTVGAYLNIFVHILMYFENVLEALSIDYRNSLIWRTNISFLFAHIVFILIQGVNTLQSNCYGSVPYGIINTTQNILFLYFFYKGSPMFEMFNAMNLKNFIKHFSKIGEMCIPNQATLFDDDSTADGTKQKNE